MIQILQFVPLPPAAQPGAAPASGDATDPAVMDFSQLLGAGMDRIADPAVPGLPLPAGVPQPVPPKPAAADSGNDPEAILSAIEAAQLPADPQQVAMIPVPVVPGMQIPAPAMAAAAAKTAAVVEEAPAKPARPGQRIVATENEARSPAQPPAPGSAREKFELPAAIRQAPEHGAAGELRAEAAARPIPDSQSATHHLLSHVSRPAAEQVAARIEQLPQQMGTPAWNEGFADRVVWMAKNDIQTAELRLNPADLGPIDVTLTLTGDDKTQATVQFSAAHATTREAIETALPRLREMMQESGITLGQAGVDANTSQAAQGERREQGNSQSGRAPTQSGVANGSVPLPAGTRTQGRGLVDTFA